MLAFYLLHTHSTFCGALDIFHVGRPLHDFVPWNILCVFHACRNSMFLLHWIISIVFSCLQARRGTASRGAGRRGAASCGEARRGSARRGEMRRGAVRRGEVRRGAVAARRGEVAARCGHVRRGAARRGEACESRYMPKVNPQTKRHIHSFCCTFEHALFVCICVFDHIANFVWSTKPKCLIFDSFYALSIG